MFLEFIDPKEDQEENSEETKFANVREYNKAVECSRSLML